MNWLELDRARVTNPARLLRKKPPDPRIGDHLPPPTVRPQEGADKGTEASAGGLGGGLSPQQSSKGLSPPVEIHINDKREEREGDGVYLIKDNGIKDPGALYVGSSPNTVVLASSSALPRSQPPLIHGVGLPEISHTSPFNSTSRFGNGRLSSVISGMRDLTVSHELRVTSLRGAAAEVSLARGGDSLDLLLQAFAGVAPRASHDGLYAPHARVYEQQSRRLHSDWRVSPNTRARPLDEGSPFRQDSSPEPHGRRVEDGDRKGVGATGSRSRLLNGVDSVPLRPPFVGSHLGVNDLRSQEDFSSTMAHTTEVCLLPSRSQAK